MLSKGDLITAIAPVKGLCEVGDTFWVTKIKSDGINFEAEVTNGLQKYTVRDYEVSMYFQIQTVKPEGWKLTDMWANYTKQLRRCCCGTTSDRHGDWCDKVTGNNSFEDNTLPPDLIAFWK